LHDTNFPIKKLPKTEKKETNIFLSVLKKKRTLLFDSFANKFIIYDHKQDKSKEMKMHFEERREE